MLTSVLHNLPRKERPNPRQRLKCFGIRMIDIDWIKKEDCRSRLNDFLLKALSPVVRLPIEIKRASKKQENDGAFDQGGE